jgi:serine/threonine protein kinase
MKKKSEDVGGKMQPGKWRVGDRIDNRYKIYRILGGEGKTGMGIVYACYDHEHKTPCVLKTFQERYSLSEQSQKLFEREALVWIELGRYPYIVRAYWVEKIEGRLFIVLEYVAPDTAGRNTLTHFLGNLSFAETLKIGIQFCFGMEYAYSKGIKVHRDIKPDNIMITQDKTVKITDFGLAKPFIESEISKSEGEYRGFGIYPSMTGKVVGTLPYMAPEQFDGYADIRSDIYAFGIVLYQMANGGKLPFVSKSRSMEESVKEYEKLWNAPPWNWTRVFVIL